MFSDLEILFQGSNFLRLLEGLLVSGRIALVSMALSIAFGIVIGTVMTSPNRIIRFITRAYLEFVRIMPQLVLLFIVFFTVSKEFDVNFEAETAAILVFTVWGTAEMSDLVRSALITLPRHQYDSGRALGFEGVSLYRHIIIPQAIKRLIPQTINLTNRMIMTTALVSLIGVVEVLKVAQQIIDANRFDYPTAALWIYAVVFLLYFAICYPIGRAAAYLEKNWSKQ